MQGQLPKMAPNSATTLDITEEILKSKWGRKKKKAWEGLPKVKMNPAFKLSTLKIYPVSKTLELPLKSMLVINQPS